MKKFRIPALILAILMAVTLFCGCQPKEKDNTPTEPPTEDIKNMTPEDLYKKSSEKMNSLQDLHMKGSMSYEYGGEVMDMDLESWEKKGANPVSKSVMTMHVSGMDLSTVVYIKDGYTYTDSFGMKMKQKIVEGETDSTSLADIANLDGYNYIKEMNSEVRDDGTFLNIVLDSKMLADNPEFGSAMAEATGGYGGEGMDLSFSDINMSITIDKNGYYSNLKMSFTMTMSIMGQSLDMGMSFDFDYIDVGSAVEIEDINPDEYYDMDDVDDDDVG